METQKENLLFDTRALRVKKMRYSLTSWATYTNYSVTINYNVMHGFRAKIWSQSLFLIFLSDNKDKKVLFVETYRKCFFVHEL